MVDLPSEVEQLSLKLVGRFLILIEQGNPKGAVSWRSSCIVNTNVTVSMSCVIRCFVKVRLCSHISFPKQEPPWKTTSSVQTIKHIYLEVCSRTPVSWHRTGKSRLAAEGQSTWDCMDCPCARSRSRYGVSLLWLHGTCLTRRCSCVRSSSCLALKRVSVLTNAPAV